MIEPLYVMRLPKGVTSSFVDNGFGLRMHVLEAGGGDPSRPVVLLLHGFPEIAYSWRKVMPALASAGFRVVAPDLRGYGLTTGWEQGYDIDLKPYRFPDLTRDLLGLLAALGVDHVKAVFGHDFGSHAAAHAALIRPDVFRALAMMSAPFSGPPALDPGPPVDIVADLAALPKARKHYQRYYSTPEANEDMWHPPQGVHDFLRAYFHYKSADWKANKPYRLGGWTALELAKMPTYYIMNLDDGMAATAAAEMPSPAEIAACGWLPDDDLAVYADVYGRIGFQGGLNWYRARYEPRFTREMQVYAGMQVVVPACYISGRSDWGVYQVPGAYERMQETACADFRGAYLLEGAGHWVQQEQADAVNRLLLRFLADI